MTVLSASADALGVPSWAIIVGVLVPVLALIGSVAATRSARRTSQDQLEVDERRVDIDERQAHTAEVAMIIEGFTQSLAATNEANERLRGELQNAIERVNQATADLNHARRDNEELRARLAGYGRQLTEMLFHVIHLEGLIPNPPGPPARPEWDPWPDPVREDNGSEEGSS